MNFPSIDSNGTLEQKAETFLERLVPEEARQVTEIVNHLKSNMPQICGSPIAVAGVGSILRCQNPFAAADIDLAVSGMKYTAAPADTRSHTFEDVLVFTTHISDYLDSLRDHLAKSNGATVKQYAIRKGSGVFADERLDRDITLTRAAQEIAKVNTELASFGQYGSKGFQIAFEGIRPIDIQFVFNRTIEGWKESQAGLKDYLINRKAKMPIFFYAML